MTLQLAIAQGLYKASLPGYGKVVRLRCQSVREAPFNLNILPGGYIITKQFPEKYMEEECLKFHGDLDFTPTIADLLDDTWVYSNVDAVVPL